MKNERESLKSIFETVPIEIVISGKNIKRIYPLSYMKMLVDENNDNFLNRSYFDPIWKLIDFAENSLDLDKLSINRIKSSLQPIINNRAIIKLPNEKKRYISINSTPRLDDKGEFDDDYTKGSIFSILIPQVIL